MRLYEVYQHLTEAQKYEQMFQDLGKIADSLPEGSNAKEYLQSLIPKIPPYIKEVRKVLKRQDRIMYFLRGVKYNILEELGGYLFDDMENAEQYKDLETAQAFKSIRDSVQSQSTKIRNNFPYVGEVGHSAFNMADSAGGFLSDIQHYLSIPYQPIHDYIWDKQLPEEIINDLQKLEDSWAKLQKRIIMPDPNDKQILKINSTQGWWLLDREHCKKEAAALGHCGNAPSRRRGDRILSYRTKVSDTEVMPHLTFILHSDGYLGEMKGRKNQKPDKKYHPAIVKLLVEKQDMIKGIRGGGYKPENNFRIMDLEDNLVEQIPDNLIHPSDAFEMILKKDYRNERMEGIIATDARHSYEYARDVLSGERFVKGEDAIATDASYSYMYARYILKGRFEKGEDAIATSARDSYEYARDVLKGKRVKKFEDAIATNAEYSYEYAKDVLSGKRVEKFEDAIATDAKYSYWYVTDVLKGKRVEKFEDAIATSAEYSYWYARYVLSGERVEKFEDAIATNAKYSYEYVIEVLKGRFEKGEDAIATNAKYSYNYAEDVLKGRFEKGEDAIATDARYSYYYANHVLSGERVEKIEDAIATSAEFSYYYARYVLKGKRVEKFEDRIATSAEYSYEYAKDVLKGKRVEKFEDKIATSAYYSYGYAVAVLKGRFEKGEDAIATSASDSYEYARDVLKARFPQGEPTIRGSRWQEDYEKLTGVKL